MRMPMGWATNCFISSGNHSWFLGAATCLLASLYCTIDSGKGFRRELVSRVNAPQMVLLLSPRLDCGRGRKHIRGHCITNDDGDMEAKGFNAHFFMMR